MLMRLLCLLGSICLLCLFCLFDSCCVGCCLFSAWRSCRCCACWACCAGWAYRTCCVLSTGRCCAVRLLPAAPPACPAYLPPWSPPLLDHPFSLTFPACRRSSLRPARPAWRATAPTSARPSLPTRWGQGAKQHVEGWTVGDAIVSGGWVAFCEQRWAGMAVTLPPPTHPHPIHTPAFLPSHICPGGGGCAQAAQQEAQGGESGRRGNGVGVAGPQHSAGWQHLALAIPRKTFSARLPPWLPSSWLHLGCLRLDHRLEEMVNTKLLPLTSRPRVNLCPLYQSPLPDRSWTTGWRIW